MERYLTKTPMLDSDAGYPYQKGAIEVNHEQAAFHLQTMHLVYKYAVLNLQTSISL